MNKLIILLCVVFFTNCQTKERTDKNIIIEQNKKTIVSVEKKNISNYKYGIEKLLLAYPDFIIGADTNTIIWFDSTIMIYDDFQIKNFDNLLNEPDIEDQFKIKYIIGKNYEIPKINEDPGRIRFEPFFKKMYGNNKKEVQKNLVPILWLPSSVNKTLYVTKINQVNKKIQAISDELDTLSYLTKYIDNPGGTFNWRKISGTNRLSVHSFGIAIDINVNYSNYWRWSQDMNSDSIPYKNKIPLEIVEIFEKHGFIWGGKWYHYDTMHFEYRPELVENE